MIQCNVGLKFADRYVLNRLLGRGGFSEVWLAKDTLTGVLVAVKIYAPGQGLDEEGVTSFSQEFSLVFDMNHTNLLHPTHFDSWKGMPFLILPYCKNGSAFKYISNGQTMPENECWKLLHDTAAGLAYLHEKQPPIIHQDIKPDNILINDEGRYMITDFGISARVRHTLRQAAAKEQSSGTMAYMGPERFSKNPMPLMASDIWSLGAMLYELMTNDAPFGNFGGGMQKGGAELPDITNDYSDSLKKVVYRCLALETWNRPSARELQEYAYAVIHGLPVTQLEGKNVGNPVSSDGLLGHRAATLQPKGIMPDNHIDSVDAQILPSQTNVCQSAERISVSMSQPLQKGLDIRAFFSSGKRRVSVGFALLGVLIICVGVCLGGSGETGNQQVYINHDSLRVDSIAYRYERTCVDRRAKLGKLWCDQNDLQNDSIERELLDIYREYAKGITEVKASGYPQVAKRLILRQQDIRRDLDSVRSYLSNQAKLMKMLDETRTQIIYENRHHIIDSTLIHTK